MLQSWHDYLARQGATIESGTVTGFGPAQAEAQAASGGDILCDLSHYALLRLTGEDAATFLQGQTTNNVRDLSPTQSQLSSYCSLKGRVLGIFRLFEREDALYLRLPAGVAADTRSHLQKYILMSKVRLEEADDALLRIGLSGSGAAARLAERVDTLPEAPDAAITAGGLTVIRVADPHRPRFEVYGEAGEIRTLWEHVAEQVTPVGADAWHLLDIQAGIPEVYPETRDAFVPQMINLHRVGGVSFHKGCYTGQEVVARMQYLGRLKRRMYRARIEGEQRPLPGAPLHCGSDESGQGAGRVVDARPAAGGGFELLVVVQITHVEEEHPCHLGGPDGVLIQLADPPYPFADEAAEAPK